ncbi:solute carrier family 41 member 3 isoform X5 [Tupaia chinensis]|uniref:solute carrier family 41 member 3 isoform X5 n=1 Tax=Tupaia chinensis TaxID=246437 RepID=UPI000FFC2296|nr:solute carrier family 41 member 3 isoform X5 [Tupaia chinensis]
MDRTETRQRRPRGWSTPEEQGLPLSLSTARPPAASGDGPPEVPESQEAALQAPEAEHSRESALSIGLQVVVPFLLAGLGLSWAGVLLNYFQANTGQIDDPREQPRVIGCNLALIQAQATVVGLLAAVAALLLGAASREDLDLAKVQLLCASSVITAFLAAFALGVLMVCIVIGARRLGVNPDNVATPIAASLGDLVTLSILALVSSFFYRYKDSRYLTPLVCIGFMALTPLWVVIAKQSAPILKILKFGWLPIILAMVISSFGGLILSRSLSKPLYKGMAVLTPVICGVGGNLVAIQTSRISTFLHMWSTPGVLPVCMKTFWPHPCSMFCSSEINSMSARVLLFLVVPGHLVFLCTIYLVEGQPVTSSRTFVALYLLAGLAQVAVLLYLAEVTVRLTWHQALDPDNHCIPYLTGLGDLLGTGLLALCFLADGLLRGGAELEGLSELASPPP